MKIPHPYARGKERLNLSPTSVQSLQKAMDKMWYSGGYRKLPDKYYHINIRDPYNNLMGYAGFKRIETKRRPRLILSTIMKHNMKPRGSNISNFLHHNLLDNTTKIDLPEKFDKLPPIPNIRTI